MNKPVAPQLLADGVEATARRRWQDEYRESIGDARDVENVSGIPILPLYTPQDWPAYGRDDPLGYPGQPDYTRGI